jgi:hypothetical protein
MDELLELFERPQIALEQHDLNSVVLQTEGQQPQAKRRRVSHEPDANAAAPEPEPAPAPEPEPVLSLSSSHQNEEKAAAVVQPTNPTDADGPSPIEPELDEIAKLVLVDLQSNDSIVVADAIKKLAKSTQMKPDKFREAYQSGAILAIIVSMRKWPNDKSIQADCCRFAANMMFHVQDAGKSVAILGGVEAILAAMKRYPDSPIIQDVGVLVCGNFFGACNYDKCRKTMERFIKELDGNEAVLHAMRAFPTNVYLQRRGCGIFLMQCLISSDYNTILKSSDAISVIGTAVSKHLDDELLQRYARSFMKAIFAL